MAHFAGYVLLATFVMLVARFVVRDAQRPWDRGKRDPDDPSEWP